MTRSHHTSVSPPAVRATAVAPPEAVRAAVVLLPLRLFLAAGWLRAAAEKLIDPEWWSGDALRAFLADQHHEALPFFRPVMTGLIAPLAVQVAIVVAVAQVLIGIAIAVGRPLRLALWAGVVLNVVFVMCGRVNPSAFYLVMEAALLYAISSGHLSHRVSREPGARSFVWIGAWLAFAAAMTPYVRTLEPADVIDDPAMMLVFLSVVMAATTFARWVHHRAPHITARTDLSVEPVRSWLTCGMTSAARRAEALDSRQVRRLDDAWRELTAAQPQLSRTR